MGMLNKVFNQTSTCLSVVLIAWVRYPCHVSYKLITFRSKVDKLYGVVVGGHTVVKRKQAVFSGGRIGGKINLVRFTVGKEGGDLWSPPPQEVHPSSCISNGPVRSKCGTGLLYYLLFVFFDLMLNQVQGGLQPVVGRL